MPARRHWLPTGWWTVTCNGVPVWFFPANHRDLAERFATDPAYRLELVSKNYQLRRASKNYRLKLASKKKASLDR